MNIYTSQKPQATTHTLENWCSQQDLDFIGFYDSKVFESLSFLKDKPIQGNVDVFYMNRYDSRKNKTFYHALLCWKTKVYNEKLGYNEYQYHYLQFEGQEAQSIVKLRNDCEKAKQEKKEFQRVVSSNVKYLENLI